MSITCEHCAALFERRPRGPVPRFCSAACRTAHHRPTYAEDGRQAQWEKDQRAKFVPKAPTPRACKVCGQEFRAVRDAACLCSESCRKRDAALRVAPIMHARRARMRGGDAERFAPEEVFRRDDWKCHVCGVATSPNAPRYDPLKTTLDHVVPLKHGGAHTQANTRCACLRCNVTRGARPLEVMTYPRTSSEAIRTAETRQQA